MGEASRTNEFNYRVTEIIHPPVCTLSICLPIQTEIYRMDRMRRRIINLFCPPQFLNLDNPVNLGLILFCL